MKRKKIHIFNSDIIASNKLAYYKYFIQEKFEAGLALQGWEVKSLRAGNANIRDSYIFFYGFEAYLLDSTIQPLYTSNYATNIPKRNRKILLHRNELESLYVRVNRDSYTLVALSLYWKNNWCKLQIGIARGKKQHDKRENIKIQEWNLNRKRIIKKSVKKC